MKKNTAWQLKSFESSEIMVLLRFQPLEYTSHQINYVIRPKVDSTALLSSIPRYFSVSIAELLFDNCI